MNDYDDQKIDNKAKEKDFWDKLTATSKIVAALAGLIASIFIPTCLQISAERNRKTQIYAEIMSQREQADTDLRAKMFETLFDKYLGDLSEQDTKSLDTNNPVKKDDDNFIKSEEDLKIKNFERKITLLNLLTNNFQEYFNAKPIFERLYRRLKKEEDEILINKISKLLSCSRNGDTNDDSHIVSAKTNRYERSPNTLKSDDPNMPKMADTISFLKTADIDALESVMDLLHADNKKIKDEKIAEYEIRLQDKRLELLMPILELELARLKELTDEEDEILRIEQKNIKLKINYIQDKFEGFKYYLECPENKPNQLKTNKKNEKKGSNADIVADIKSLQNERICKYLLKSEKIISEALSNISDNFDSAKDLEDFYDKRKDPNNDLSEAIEIINNLQKYIARSRHKIEWMDSFKDKNNTYRKKLEKIGEYLEDKRAELTIEQDCNALEGLDFDLCKLKQLDKNLGTDPNNEEAIILNKSINELTEIFENLDSEKYSKFVLYLLENVSNDLEREKLLMEIELAIDNIIKEVERFILSSNNKIDIKNLKTNIEMHLTKLKVSFSHKYIDLIVTKIRCKDLRKGHKTYETSFINKLRENIERIKNRRKLRNRLISLAQTTVSRQVNMLARVGTIRTVSLHKNYKEQCLIRLYDTNGYKYNNELDKNLNPFTYSIDDIQPSDNQPFFFNPSKQKVHHYSVWIKIIDLQEDNVKIAVKVFRDHFKKRLFRKQFIYLYSELVETEAINFWVSYFDMPYMDNTRLYDGSRFAVTLKDLDLDKGYVLIQLASFREEFMSIRDRPLFEEMLMKIKDH